MADDRTWLRHPETGGYHHCATAAVADWLELGWEPSDPKPEINHATVEQPQRPAPEPVVEAVPAVEAKKSNTKGSE